MFILDSLLIGSLRFVLDKVVQAAEAEMQDDSALREQLLEAQMRPPWRRPSSRFFRRQRRRRQDDLRGGVRPRAFSASAFADASA